MRHAKSSWKTDAPTDWHRPLNKRGRRDAPRVAAALAARGWAPEAVVASDSARTRETWARMADAFPDTRVAFEAGLYHGDLRAIQGAAASWDAGWGCVLTLGHNPGWEDALAALCGVEEVMTTGNAALLVGAGATWAEALAGPWRLEALIRPREL